MNTDRHRYWSIEEAKEGLSEVFDCALNQGPQIIQKDNDTVVMISQLGFDLLKGKKQSFTEFLMNGPGLDEVALNRSRETMRDVQF